MRLDLTHRHATGVQREDLVIKPRPPCLVLGHDLRLKAAIAVSRNINGQFAKFTLERLLALAVSGVALGAGNGLVLVVSKVLSHLGFEGSLNQSFG